MGTVATVGTVDTIGTVRRHGSREDNDEERGVSIVASMRFDTLNTRCVGHGVPAHARLARACAHLLHHFA